MTAEMAAWPYKSPLPSRPTGRPFERSILPEAVHDNIWKGLSGEAYVMGWLVGLDSQ